MESMKATGMKGSFFCGVFFFCLRDYTECFLSFCFFRGETRGRGDKCGWKWKRVVNLGRL